MNRIACLLVVVFASGCMSLHAAGDAHMTTSERRVAEERESLPYRTQLAICKAFDLEDEARSACFDALIGVCAKHSDVPCLEAIAEVRTEDRETLADGRSEAVPAEDLSSDPLVSSVVRPALLPYTPVSRSVVAYRSRPAGVDWDNCRSCLRVHSLERTGAAAFAVEIDGELASVMTRGGGFNASYVDIDRKFGPEPYMVDIASANGSLYFIGGLEGIEIRLIYLEYDHSVAGPPVYSAYRACNITKKPGLVFGTADSTSALSGICYNL